MVMSPYCSLALQNNPRSTIHSLYRKMREMIKGKEIKIHFAGLPSVIGASTITCPGWGETSQRLVKERPYIDVLNFEVNSHFGELFGFWDESARLGDVMKKINEVCTDLIRAWKVYNRVGTLTDLDAVKRINSGDCGMAAIAIHHVLKYKFGIDTNIWINRNHCWLEYKGVDFDTMHPTGYDTPFGASTTWSSPDGEIESKTQLDFQNACDEWMPCDTFGAYFVQGFCARYELSLPKELQHCIDNAGKYDSLEMAKNFQERAQEVQLYIQSQG